MAEKVCPSTARIDSGGIDLKLTSFNLSGEKWLLAPQSMIKSVSWETPKASWLWPEVMTRGAGVASPAMLIEIFGTPRDIHVILVF